MEEAFRECPLGPHMTTGGDGRALLFGHRDERVDTLELRSRDDRPDVRRRLEPASQTELLCAAHQLVDEPLGHAGLCDDAGGRGAPLS